MKGRHGTSAGDGGHHHQASCTLCMLLLLLLLNSGWCCRTMVPSRRERSAARWSERVAPATHHGLATRHWIAMALRSGVCANGCVLSHMIHTREWSPQETGPWKRAKNTMLRCSARRLAATAQRSGSAASCFAAAASVFRGSIPASCHASQSATPAAAAAMGTTGGSSLSMCVWSFSCSGTGVQYTDGILSSRGIQCSHGCKAQLCRRHGLS